MFLALSPIMFERIGDLPYLNSFYCGYFLCLCFMSNILFNSNLKFFSSIYLYLTLQENTRVRIKINSTAHKNKNKTRITQQNITPRPHITVPYYRGLSESIKHRCKNYGVQVYFRGGTTIKNLLMAPKDLDPMMKKSGVIYSYKCGRVECDEEYIGESSRTFEERFKEHQKAPSPIFDHFNTTGHSISAEHFNIVGREDQNLKRAIKEALYIRVNNPSLNRNVGKYHLPHIWDEVLCNIPELKLK